MFYNPRIYNYSNLNERDKEIADMMLMQLEEIEFIGDDYLDVANDEDSLIKERIEAEIKLMALTDVYKHLFENIIEFMISCIEHYEDDVVEIDTNNFLFGYQDEEQHIHPGEYENVYKGFKIEDE